MASNVLQLLEKINRASQRINNPGLSKLEYDLLMQHVRDMYDALDTMRHTGKSAAPVAEIKAVQQPVTESKQVEEIIITAPVVDRVAVANTAETMPAFNTQEEAVQAPVVKQAPVIEKRVEPAVVLRDEPVVIAHNTITDMVEQAVPINERVKSSGDLNERWKGAANEVHHKYAVKPLKDMIDLNRRIAFVNELFKGNGEELSKAVQTIDSYTDYDTAKVYVNSLARTWNWFESSQTAKLFVKLVKQRFGQE